MKRKNFFCLLVLMVFLISGCTQINTQGPDNISAPDSAASSISAKDAKNIALDQVPGATLKNIRDFESDYDNGKLHYEGKIHYEQTVYEFEIDALNGTITKWNVESIFDDVL